MGAAGLRVAALCRARYNIISPSKATSTANCPIRLRTEIAVRDVGTVLDEPKEREGTKMGPTATETMVAALIACTNVISHKCAKRHGVELKVMTIDAESTFDRRGALRARIANHLGNRAEAMQIGLHLFQVVLACIRCHIDQKTDFWKRHFDFLEQLRSGT